MKKILLISIAVILLGISLACANINLPKINSSAGIRLESICYTDIGDAWSLQLAYAYKHSFSEDLQLNG